MALQKEMADGLDDGGRHRAAAGRLEVGRQPETDTDTEGLTIARYDAAAGAAAARRPEAGATA